MHGLLVPPSWYARVAAESVDSLTYPFLKVSICLWPEFNRKTFTLRLQSSFGTEESRCMWITITYFNREWIARKTRKKTQRMKWSRSVINNVTYWAVSRSLRIMQNWSFMKYVPVWDDVLDAMVEEVIFPGHWQTSYSVSSNLSLVLFAFSWLHSVIHT